MQLHSDRKDTRSPLLDQPGCQMRLIIPELVATDTIITDINSDVNISLLFSESLSRVFYTSTILLCGFENPQKCMVLLSYNFGN